jgi:hypothetical protein
MSAGVGKKKGDIGQIQMANQMDFGSDLSQFCWSRYLILMRLAQIGQSESY